MSNYLNNHFRKPDFFIDIFLQPGEFYFGDRETRVRTLLGSCVAITLWHPRLQIGGMCHYLLPSRSANNDKHELDGRYAHDVIRLFMLELERSKTWPIDYEVKLFGGGNQFPGQEKPNTISIPENNIRAGRNMLTQHGFAVKAEHLGGTGHRNVIFDMWSGHVWLRHVAIR